MSANEIRTMRFDRHFQRAIIKMMMTDHQFCHRCSELLKPAHFINELTWFYTKAAEYYGDHGQMPTREFISGEITKQPVTKQQEYYDELDEILKVEPDSNTVKANMTDFVRANIFVASAREAANKYNRGPQEKAFEYMKLQLEELYKADFGADPFTRFGDAKAVLNEAKAESQGAIKTGIKAIDDEIIGLLPGTFSVFLGASNAGKSMLGPMLAKMAAAQGKRTFITIHEDEEIPTKIRYLACFADLPINKLQYGQHMLTEEELKRVEEADKLLKEFVVLRFMYTTEATVENVMDVARGLIKTWKFDLFICDYGQCLTSKAHGKLEMRHLHEHIYHMLKQLCLELKIAGAGGAQVNRSGMAMSRSGADYLRCTDVSEAYGIIKKATNVITINRSNSDVANNRIVFLLDKARNGKCPVAVEMVSNFAHATAYRPELNQTVLSIDAGPAKMEIEDTPPKQSFG